EYLVQLRRDDAHRAKVEKHTNIFKRVGFSYDGVHDGNDIEGMVAKLQEVKEKLKTQSVILHIVTKKGKGYSFCEEFPQETHGISGAGKVGSVDYSQVLGKTLCRLAQDDKRIVAVTAAMTPSLGLSEFFKLYPERSIDVGICEEHATILCAALAAQGLKPFYAVYSTFLQRSFDEIIIDICSQKLPVTLCIDRAGISGEDGETHQGVFDLSFLNLIPELTIAVPKDCEEFEAMLEASLHFNLPLAIRYPKECKNVFDGDEKPLVMGKWEYLLHGNCNIAILACGERAISIALEVAEKAGKSEVKITVVNARFVKPLDLDLLSSLKENLIVTLEDNQLIGGFGSLVSQHYSRNNGITVKSFAYEDKFIPHGKVSELMDEFGLNGESVFDYIMQNADR
ncbi:MAG: 1-deoxy-D-xylulose-5-phosphate synthase, partial [Clostridia bacterium]|nr:1-deoxy-D-xylulose-5-phosphate synthase [Clostridia bacterium]